MYPADESLPCHLGNLPDELLLAIVAQLDVRRRFLAIPEHEAKRRKENGMTVRALHGLALTCRKLNAITTATLYQCVIQDEDRIRTTKLLLQTLASKPELTKYIRYIEGHECASGQKKALEQLYTHADLLTYEQSLASAEWGLPCFSFNFSSLLPSELKGGSIEIYAWTCLKKAWRRDRLEFAVATLIALAENLNEVAIHYRKAPLAMLAFKRYPIDGGLRCLWLKNMSKYSCPLRTYKANPTPLYNPLAQCIREEFFSDPDEPSPLVELEEISLDVLDVNKWDIADPLDYCSSLKRFACRWMSANSKNPDRQGYLNQVDLPAMRQSLLRFETSLTSLTINTMDSSCLVDMDMDIPAFGSFCEFVVLQHLDVSGLVLWGDCDNVDYPRLSTMLPESLETLKIKAEWDEDVEDAFHNLCEDGCAAVPHLKSVECTWDPAPRVTAEILIETFKELNVELVLRITDGDMDAKA